MTQTRQLYDNHGKIVLLAKLLGTGGEGSVFDVATGNGFVAKLYHKQPPRAKAEKLRAMIAAYRPELLSIAAWPVATLHERPGGSAVGLVMPKIADGKEIHTLYSPAHRKTAFPSADWAFLLGAAASCAEAFGMIHATGAVIGDVNQSGVFVSNQGKARLIDCDSFQIQSNGTTYFCDVGVPQFTPPELQNRAFSGLARTQNHDLFGLAVLIFHLLYMGRHPYAGRYLGKGHMPIEMAISQHRFAYGQRSAQLLMQATLHTPPLTVATPLIADLFERAFASTGATGSRPKASEWNTALVNLRRQLRQCQNDAGHVHPASLAGCPWCELASKGAPNYFISVAFTRTGGKVTSFDLQGVWSQIESIRYLQRGYIRPAALPATPRPLPRGLPTMFPPRIKVKTTQNQMIAIFAAVAAALMSIPLFFVLIGFGIVFLIASFGFAIWYAIQEYERQEDQRALDRTRDEELRPLTEEIGRRYDVLARAEQDLHNAETSLQAIEQNHKEAFATRRAGLESSKAEHVRLGRQYVEERQQIQANARAKQLELYLQQQFISDHRIEGIGRAKMAALGYAGIETAFDISKEAVFNVTGIGEKLTNRLVEWRRQVENQFVFTPAQGVPASVQQALDMKFYSLRQSVETSLRDGPIVLRAIVTKSEADFAQQIAFIKSVMARYAQATADTMVLPAE